MDRSSTVRAFFVSFALASFALVAVLQGADADPGLASIKADALKGHIYFLASDAMGGRDSLSLEGRIAAEYIAGFYHRAGLKPVGDNRTYFQNFPMTAGHIDREHTYLRASIGKDGATTRDFAMARITRWAGKATSTPRRGLR